MTAYIAEGDCETLRRVLRLGVADCLVDPFDTSRFEQAVERFLRRMDLAGGEILAGGGGYALRQHGKGAGACQRPAEKNPEYDTRGPIEQTGYELFL